MTGWMGGWVDGWMGIWQGDRVAGCKYKPIYNWLTNIVFVPATIAAFKGKIGAQLQNMSTSMH